eukprot:3682714-Pyramimonas_sp.AAC.1
MSNAFPSTNRETLEQVVGEIIPDIQAQGYFLQRHKEAVMEIRSGTEKAFYVPRHGAGMGDGNACELFVRSFVRPL